MSVIYENISINLILSSNIQIRTFKICLLLWMERFFSQCDAVYQYVIMLTVLKDSCTFRDIRNVSKFRLSAPIGKNQFIRYQIKRILSINKYRRKIRKPPIKTVLLITIANLIGAYLSLVS